MGLGLGISVYWATQSGPAAAIVSAFKSRVIADGGTVESPSCAKSDVKFLLDNPEPVDFTGLLNDYSGAAAAYSLRLLDNTYSGNAIKVRRSSDNAEQDIAFVNNELDTASLESFAGSGNAFVTTWYDQSGSGNNATQTTASDQPKIVSSGSTILENGKPAFEFDGSNSGLDFTTSLNYSLGYSFNVLNPKTNSQWGLFHNGSNIAPLAQSGSSSSRSFGYSLINLWSNSSSVGITRNDVYTSTTNKQNLLSMQIDTDSLNITGFFDRSAFELDGTSQELIVYTSDQSSNRSGIETNINDFYSIY